MKATTQTKESIIFTKTTGEIICYGSLNGGELIPNDCDTNIEEICSGLLAAINT